jgi:hypothetical protein
MVVVRLFINGEVFMKATTSTAIEKDLAEWSLKKA